MRWSIYQNVSDPITYLFGSPDNITMMQLYDEMQRLGFTSETLLGNSKKLKQLSDAAIAVAKRQTRIIPKDDNDYQYVVNLMPQRYMPKPV